MNCTSYIHVFSTGSVYLWASFSTQVDLLKAFLHVSHSSSRRRFQFSRVIWNFASKHFFCIAGQMVAASVAQCALPQAGALSDGSQDPGFKVGRPSRRASSRMGSSCPRQWWHMTLGKHYLCSLSWQFSVHVPSLKSAQKFSELCLSATKWKLCISVICNDMFMSWWLSESVWDMFC